MRQAQLVATAGVDADVFTAVALTRALVQLWGGGGREGDWSVRSGCSRTSEGQQRWEGDGQ